MAKPLTPAEMSELRYLLKKAVAYDERRRTSCDGKAAFDSPELARRVLPKRFGGKASVYRCRFCSKWHVGSHLSPKAANQGRPRRDYLEDAA